MAYAENGYGVFIRHLCDSAVFSCACSCWKIWQFFVVDERRHEISPRGLSGGKLSPTSSSSTNSQFSERSSRVALDLVLIRYFIKQEWFWMGLRRRISYFSEDLFDYSPPPPPLPSTQSGLAQSWVKLRPMCKRAWIFFHLNRLWHSYFFVLQIRTYWYLRRSAKFTVCKSVDKRTQTVDSIAWFLS